MAIASIAKPSEEKNEWDYPCLGISKTGKAIILFSSSGVGTVVHADLSHTIGFHSEELRMNSFTRYYGTVTLDGTYNA